MTNDSEKNVVPRDEKILRHCNDLIAYYEKSRSAQRNWYQFLQSTVIVLSALTPVLILWADLPKWLQALPAAVASMAAGMIGVFRYHENWVSSKDTAEALKSELLAFETRTTEYYRTDLDDDTALDNFIVRIESIHKGQISVWSTGQLQKTAK